MPEIIFYFMAGMAWVVYGLIFHHASWETNSIVELDVCSNKHAAFMWFIGWISFGIAIPFLGMMFWRIYEFCS